MASKSNKITAGIVGVAMAAGGNVGFGKIDKEQDYQFKKQQVISKIITKPNDLSTIYSPDYTEVLNEENKRGNLNVKKFLKDKKVEFKK